MIRIIIISLLHMLLISCSSSNVIQGNRGTSNSIKETRIGKVNTIEIGFAGHKKNKEKRIVNIRLFTTAGSFTLICNWDMDQQKNYDSMVNVIEKSLSQFQEGNDNIVYNLKKSTLYSGLEKTVVSERFYLDFNEEGKSENDYFSCGNIYYLKAYNDSDRRMSPEKTYHKMGFSFIFEEEFTLNRGYFGPP